jgi:hypothetical protein
MAKIWDYNSNEDDELGKQVEKDPNIVMTQPEMAKYLLSRIDFYPDEIIMEPGLGTGSFYNNFPTFTNNKFCEINLGLDYLLQNEIVDYTISNPPFVPRKLFWNFNVHAMKTTKKEIYWLINISALNVFTPKRLEEMKSLGWYIQDLHIVSDKRWFGRYCFLRMSKDISNFFTYSKSNF